MVFSVVKQISSAGRRMLVEGLRQQVHLLLLEHDGAGLAIPQHRIALLWTHAACAASLRSTVRHESAAANMLVEHASPGAADLLNYTENHAWPCQGWPLTVGALDWFARKVASSVTDYAAGGRQGPSCAFFVTNTDDCRSDGVHWISVAISMRWDPPPPL